MKSTKDEIGFHNLLLSVRRHRGVSLEKLGYGLYSSAMMHYIESGERLPDYLMRNRIMDRLGISAEDYTDYVSSEEFYRYQMRNELIEAVETEQTDIARRKLEYLLSSCDEERKIEYQFLLDMKARIMMQEQHPIGEIAEIYEQVIAVSMPDINLNKLDEYILSADEYYLLILWIRTSYMAGNITFNEAEYALSSIIKTLEKSFFQEIPKCKVHPAAVVALFDLYKKEENLESNIIKSRMIQLSNKAIELLRSRGRLYYIIELLEIKDSLKCTDEKNKKWLETFKGLYDEYKVHRNMNYSCYIYKSIFVINTGEIVKSRREMLGITKKNLAEGICIPKTIERIEKGQNQPQQIVLKGLMEKLGVNGDYCRTDIHTNNDSLIQAYNECIYALNRKNNDAVTLFDTIRTNIDNNAPNQQELIRIINIEKLREGKISTERFVENIYKALQLTGIDIGRIKNLSGYLTSSELQSIYIIACRGGKTEKGKICTNFMVELCENILNKQIPGIEYALYELIMSWYANKLGNEGDYYKSSKISQRLIIDSLCRHRATTIAKESYNIVWNEAVQDENNCDNHYLRELQKIEYLYEYCHRKNKAIFIHKKIEKISNGNTWT